MPQMCQNPGCPHLAVDRISIEGVAVVFCYHCSKKARANLPWIQEQLRQHEHGAKCEAGTCNGRADKQLLFGGQWINVCAPCERKLTENLEILSGKKPPLRPLKTYYAQAPEVIIEDLGWVEKPPP